ncbi:MAG: DUF1156 domain-containing protein [Candidatus Xenobiia bacterium LiM19]
MSHPVYSPRKLIEVALPLDAINTASTREKSIRHGHPSTLHLWWARRPLATARAVIFAQLVNDPGYQQDGGFKYGMNKKDAAVERKRLFKIIEELVQWENTTNEEVLERARAEIRRSWREVCELNKNHPQAAELFNPDKLPALHDPFAGGGSIPLEAQRLGLEAYASDLNPVAVLINKAMIEIPPKFAGRPPVNPESRQKIGGTSGSWPGATGLAEDVRYYGKWMRDEAYKRIGHLYPPVEITPEMAKDRPDLRTLVGRKLTVIAWLWARTVKSPNPAFSHVDVPLISTFILSSKPGKEAYVEPVVDGDRYRFTVKVGKPPAGAECGTKASGRGANFRCILSDAPVSGDYIKAEGQAGRMGAKLMAVVVEGERGRVYLAPTDEIESITRKAEPAWKPSGNVPARLTGGTCVPYGLKEWGDLFTPRQLVALMTFSDLVVETREKIRIDAIAASINDDRVGIETGGRGATAYAEAVSLYLAFACDKVADRGSTLGRWDPTPTQSGIINTFSRQALPMTWDFAESNPLGNASGNFVSSADLVSKSLSSVMPSQCGLSYNLDACSQSLSRLKFISTDPPYYNNISYADLSDFFYVWLRRALRSILPNLLATITVPKAEELIATPYRHETKEKAELFFLNGMTQAINNLSEQTHPAAGAMAFYEDTQRYFYLPRLKTRKTLEQAIIKGAGTMDFFGTALGKSDSVYEGFKLGDSNVQLDDTLLLIEPGEAASYAEQLTLKAAQKPVTVSGGSQTEPASPVAPISVPTPGAGTITVPVVSLQETARAKAFYGSVEVNAGAAKMRLSELADEIIAVLASDPQAKVKITLEINAEFPQGADEQIRRVVSENANSLGFKNKTWE